MRYIVTNNFNSNDDVVLYLGRLGKDGKDGKDGSDGKECKDGYERNPMGSHGIFSFKSADLSSKFPSESQFFCGHNMVTKLSYKCD